MTFTQNFALALPETILAASAMVLLIYGAFSPRSTLAVNAGGALALVLAAAAAAFGKQGIAFNGAFVADNASASPRWRSTSPAPSPCRWPAAGSPSAEKPSSNSRCW